jgi:ubiquinone biosynthesis protein
LFRELDFQAERRNLEQFRRFFADNPSLHFPGVHTGFCSRQVLTMDYVPGIHGTDLEGLRASGVDLGEFTRRAGLMYLDMIFRDGFYHADPHPGNFVLMADGVLGVLDCGMVGRLDETYREDFEDFLLAVLRNDAHTLTHAVFRLAATPPLVDESALRLDLAELAADVSGQSLNQFDLAGTLERVVEIVHRFHILLPPHASLLIKTLIMLEGTARRLQPSFNLAELIEEYRERSIHRRLLPARWARKAERTVREWDRFLSQLPTELTQLLNRMRAGTLEIHHVHRQLEATVNRLVVGLLTASLLLASSWLLSQSGRGGLHVSLVIVGAVGLSVAVILLVALLREIHRTHNRDLE